jgi:hypothetical protein
MVNAGLVGIVIVFTIIAAAFSSYYVTIAPINGQISSYQSEVTSLSQHASSATVTTTSYLVSIVTVTSSGATTTVTTVTTSTVTEFPLTKNVTVFFQNSGSLFSYVVTSSSFHSSGSTNHTSVILPVTPVYNGELLSISASCGQTCKAGATFNATLYIDSKVCATGAGLPGNPLSINYTLTSSTAC